MVRASGSGGVSKKQQGVPGSDQEVVLDDVAGIEAWSVQQGQGVRVVDDRNRACE
jgi:hypothetical protein